MSAPSVQESLSLAEAERQSLASGTAGRALLAIEQALNGADTWSTARYIIRQMTTGPIDAAAHTGLYYGGPAIAFVLDATMTDGRDRYPAARKTLHQHLRRLTRARLSAATERLRSGQSPAFAEYDLFYGLTGIGALLLRLAPDSDELGDLLRYTARLTEPRRHDGGIVPGWWVDHDPDPLLPTPGGHANIGMAHGAAGLLALLAHAHHHGYRVPGQREAIERLCAWFDHWQQDSPDGPWWPQWLTRTALTSGRPDQHHPGKPSWCYGTPGVARALQLAALATADSARQAAAEHALAACLTEPQLDRLTDAGLCHGIAGLYQTAWRAAADSATPAIIRQLPAIAARLTHGADTCTGEGLLTGRIGVALTVETIRTGQLHTGWDTCLLIT